MPTQVTLDRYAEIRAEMEAGALRDEALARAGLSADEWTATQREWLESMGAEIARGRFELTHRYAQAFLERQRALKAAPAAPIALASADTPPLEVVPRVVEATPTFLAAGPVAEVVAPNVPVVRPPSPLLSGTMSVDVSAFQPALPFDPKAQAAPPPPPPPAPPVKRAPAALSGTSMGFVAPKGPALPFAPGAGSAPTSPVAAATPATTPMSAPPVKRAPSALSGTSMGFVAPRAPALPFARPDTPPNPASASPPAAATAAPVVKRAPAALSGTSMAIVAPKAPALPFAKGTSTPPSVAPDSKASAPPPLPRSAEPSTPTTAPATAPDTPPSSLSLEQYASLCVELGAAPAKAADIFRAYGITDEQGRAVDAYWKKRVGADPAVRAAFDRAYHAYKAWFDGARGKASRA